MVGHEGMGNGGGNLLADKYFMGICLSSYPWRLEGAAMLEALVVLWWKGRNRKILFYFFNGKGLEKLFLKITSTNKCLKHR